MQVATCNLTGQKIAVCNFFERVILVNLTKCPFFPINLPGTPIAKTPGNGSYQQVEGKKGK
ncbi:MAG TPA: hypothetical protein VGY56_08505 [Verrucomicrobiae bacterium]|nr:hypothetical protein [Verrucomicrobiae bacterium]